MKFFIINSDYSLFIQKEYKNNPGLRFKKFNDQLTKRYESLFGVSNFYSQNLKKLGHDAIDIICNHGYIQKQWAKENSVNYPMINNLLSKIPFVRRKIKPKWIEIILREQISKFKPDIIYNMAMENITSPFLNSIKKNLKVFVVGQHAAPINKEMQDLSAYDLILTSLPNYIEHFRSKGIKSEYLQLGFEPSILDRLPTSPSKKYDVVYIGGFGDNHGQRSDTLEFLANQKDFRVDYWGYGTQRLKKSSGILKKFHGFVGGIEMYKILQRSKICINGHINISGNYANNMRLYEATGTGTMLITDNKKNIGEIFEINKEIVTYEDKIDLVKKIRYYLKNHKDLIRISKAGQKRTLNNHNYLIRMETMLKIIKKYQNEK